MGAAEGSAQWVDGARELLHAEAAAGSKQEAEPLDGKVVQGNCCMPILLHRRVIAS